MGPQTPFHSRDPWGAWRGGLPWRRRFAAAWPWVFVIGVAIGTVLPLRHSLRGTASSFASRTWPDPAHEILITDPRGAEPVATEVLRTIDGDTFVARVRWDGRDIVTRVRLRGIDAPELKASCASEFRRAVAATHALRGLLAEGNVAIFNLGPDKYAGRIVADVKTARTANVSAALLAAGHARSYTGGHRDGWCGGSSWWRRW